MRRLTFIEGTLIYIISSAFMILFGGYVQMKFGYFGIFLSQLILIVPCVFYLLILKLDFKEVFRVNKISFKSLVKCFFGWIIGYLIISLILNFLLINFPELALPLESLDEVLFNESLLLNLFVVAFMPAVCEELLFRGFIMTSFKKQKLLGVVVSSIMFGLLHLYPIKIISTSLLGFVIGLSVYKTNSIYAGIFIHFINNGIAVLLYHII